MPDSVLIDSAISNGCNSGKLVDRLTQCPAPPRVVSPPQPPCPHEWAGRRVLLWKSTPRGDSRFAARGLLTYNVPIRNEADRFPGPPPRIERTRGNIRPGTFEKFVARKFVGQVAGFAASHRLWPLDRLGRGQRVATAAL